jgi:hypothetical protein
VRVNSERVAVPARPLLPQESYLAKRGKRFVAQLPRALTTDELAGLAHQLGCDPGHIHFITAIPPKVEPSKSSRSMFDSGPFRQPEQPEQQQQNSLNQAVQRVRAYLANVGITKLDDQAIAAVLEKQSKHVAFLHENQSSHGMRLFMHGHGGTSPESTEGLTKTGPEYPRFERPTGINIENHTWGTLVHELFHGLEHPKLRNLSDMLVEGMTELLTQRATGLDVRCSRDGGEVYKQNVQLLRMALDRGVIDDQQIRDAYFHGQISLGIRQVDRACQGPGRQMQPGHRLATPEETATAWQGAERMLVAPRAMSITAEEVQLQFGVERSDLKEHEVYTQRSTGQTYRYDGPAMLTLTKHKFSPM